MFDDSMYNSDCDWDINKAAYKVIIMFPSIMVCGFFIKRRDFGRREMWGVEDFVKGLEGEMYEDLLKFMELWGWKSEENSIKRDLRQDAKTLWNFSVIGNSEKYYDKNIEVSCDYLIHYN